MDAAPDANILSTTDLTSAITYANEDFINVSGYHRGELIGAPYNLLRHPDMPAATFAHMWQTLKNGRSWMGMVKNRCKNGDHYWARAYATPVPGIGLFASKPAPTVGMHSNCGSGLAREEAGKAYAALNEINA